MTTWIALLGILSATLGASRAPAAPAAQESYTLNIYNEGGGKTVMMQDLIDLIRTLSPNADVKWDLSGGIMLIEAGSSRIQVLSRTSAVIINGKQKPVSRPVLVRSEGVYIPIETVRIVFDAMGVNFDIKDETPAAEPAPTPAAAPQVPAVPLMPEATATPQPTSTPTPAPAPAATIPPLTAPAPAPSATPAPAAPAVPMPKILPSYRDKAQPTPDTAASGAPETPLQPPDSLAGKIGLSWGQLADLSHRTPPRRITLVHDGDFTQLAEAVADRLRQSQGLDVNLVAVNSSRRDSEGLVSRVAQTQPELLIDLVGSPMASDAAFTVWTVHEALWPRDREAGRTAGDATIRYRRHEFQSMALGSLLRAHLGGQFSGQAIRYELSPSYLLRRVDAPAAMVLIPASDDAGTKRLVTALSEAVGEYVQRMARFSK